MKKFQIFKSAGSLFTGSSYNVLDNLLEGCQIISPDWRYLYVNDAFVKQARQSKERLLGRTMMEVYPGIEKTAMFAVLKRCMEEHQPHMMENEFIFPDESKGWFELRFKRVSEGVFILSMDITERKQMEEALRDDAVRWKILVEQSRDGIVVLDENGKVYESNQKFANMLGYSMKEVYQLHVWDWDAQWTKNQLVQKIKEIDDIGDHFETRHFRKDGTLLDVEISTNGANYRGRKLVFCVCRDITQRKQAEEALLESEKLFRNLVDSAPEGIFVHNKGRFLFLNPSMVRIFGAASAEELIGTEIMERIVPKYHKAARNRIRSRSETGGPSPLMDQEYLRMDGSTVSVETTGVSIRFQGEDAHLVFVRDITERKRAEVELRLKNQVFETAITANSTIDNNGILTHVNRAFVKTWGYERKKEVLGKCISKFLKFEEDEKKIIASLNETGKWEGEFTALRRDGTTFFAYGLATSIKDESLKLTGYQSAVLDISEKKLAQEGMRESEEKYRKVTEAMASPMHICSSDFKIEYMNPAMIKKIGRDGTGETCYKLIHSLNEQCSWCVHDKIQQGKHIEIEIVSPKDNRNYDISNVPLIQRDGSISKIAIYRDITERKQKEKALLESEEKYRKLFYNAEVGMYRTRLDGSELIEANLKFLDIAGATQEEIIGKPSVNLWADPEERDEMAKKLAAYGSVSAFEFKMLNKRQGDVRDCLTSAILYREQGILEGSIVDITDLKKAEKEKQQLEAQLQQSLKMEAIGKLAGGIAHDFNNLLTTIIGNADFALDETGENRSLYNEIEEIRKAGRQAAALTRQLLAFSRKQIIQPQILNLNDILENTEKMLRRTIGEDIEFKTMFEPNLWDVKVDPGQIEQILMNLVVNARDAMPDGGKLAIETANVQLDDVYFLHRGVKGMPGSYAMLAITDTGTGMDEKTRNHIFEPFFTTKEMGHGTGLGLSTVYGIVKQNNGHIWVYSEPGKGTTFKIYFPRIAGDEASDIEEPLDENQLKGSETILVAEDNEKLLKLTQRMLESYGYKVLTAQNATEAMETFNRDNGSIHLLLTDMVMPGMNGRKLAEHIQSESSKVKVLYMSGYTDDTISKHGILHDDVEFIEKPFSQKDLGLKVREVLG